MSQSVVSGQRRRTVIGYVFGSKKRSWFHEQVIAKLDAERYEFREFHLNGSDEGDDGVDVIMHKISELIARARFTHDAAAEVQVERLQAIVDHLQRRRGGVVVLDPLPAVRVLCDRAALCTALDGLDVCVDGVRVRQPSFALLPADAASSTADANALSAFRFPIVCKPYVADGVPESHECALAYSAAGVAALRRDKPTTSLVLQQFVNHGAVLYKVYVVGERVHLLYRPSLHDIDDGDERHQRAASTAPYYQYFDRISNARLNSESSVASRGVDDGDAVAAAAAAKHGAPPSERLLSTAAVEIGRRLGGATMFGVDLVRDADDHGSMYVIDVNYMPGYYAYEGFADALALHIGGLVG